MDAVNNGNTPSTITNNQQQTNNYQNQPFKCLANSIEPKFLLAIIVDRLESHKQVDINASTAMGTSNAPNAATNNNNNNATSQSTAASTSCQAGSSSKVKCVPSARTINCQHHCVAILATRLFAILCNEPSFQQKLVSNENSDACFNMIIEILYPNNDPVNYYPMLLLLFLLLDITTS